MMRELTERFMEALHQLHADRDVEPMVALYSDDATLTKLGDQNEAHGTDGARTFWENYRAVFDGISSTFDHTIVGETAVSLEWVSQGSLRGGHPFSYAGASMLEGDAEKISSFRTYYDSAAFVGEPVV